MIGLAQFAQARVGPVANRNHYGILVHVELPTLVELKQSLPAITKAVRPLAGIGILLVPDELLCPEPTLRAQRLDQLEYVGMPLPIDNAFLDVENERAARFQNAQQFLANRRKPCDVFVGVHAAVGILAAVGVGWRCDDQVDGVTRQSSELMYG